MFLVAEDKISLAIGDLSIVEYVLSNSNLEIKNIGRAKTQRLMLTYPAGITLVFKLILSF
jgi:hypothetical protein